MTTKLVLHIQDPEGDSSYAIEVEESFEEVLNKIVPLQGTSSALEFRDQCIYRTVDGSQVLVKPQSIEVAMEVPDGES